MKMNYEANIQQAFAEEKKRACSKVRSIYQNIFHEVSFRPVDKVPAEIISKEALQINGCISALKRDMKALSMRLITESGIPENKTEIIWAGVSLTVGMPKAQLCHMETVKIKGNTSENGGQKRTIGQDGKKEINRLTAKRNSALKMTATGVAVEAVSWLVVPGWNGVSVFAKTAGAVIIGVGAVNAVNSQVQIAEKNRLCSVQKQQKTDKEEQKEVEKLMKEICEKQAECNEVQICNWIDIVCETLISKCRQESE